MKISKRLIFGMVCTVLFSMILIGCDATVDSTAVVVSDAFTSNWDGSGADPGEMLPNVHLFKIPDKKNASLITYLTASKISNLTVRFSIRDPRNNSWVQIGPELTSDSNGKVKLNSLRNKIPAGILNLAPVRLELKAEAQCKDGWAADSEGILQILSKNTSVNPDVLLTDHDNTIHATGGANSPTDWINFLNLFGNDWPYVDNYVEYVLPNILDRADVVIITGQPETVRQLTRNQMSCHFPKDGKRVVPIICKSDMDYAESSDYKAATISILRNLYGSEHCLSMVGDTASEDGYGALASGVDYIPFQIKYLLLPDSLEIGGGFNPVNPDDIADDWQEVYNRIF